MNSIALRNIRNLVSATAIIVGVIAIWSSGEGFAASAEATATVKPKSQAVVDKAPELDLDLKIFLHRNGFVLTDGREPGRG